MLGTEKISIVTGSVETIVESIVVNSKGLDLRLGRPEEFERSLVKEVKFLPVFECNEWPEVERYIHQHLPELYQLAISRV